MVVLALHLRGAGAGGAFLVECVACLEPATMESGSFAFLIWAAAGKACSCYY